MCEWVFVDYIVIKWITNIHYTHQNMKSNKGKNYVKNSQESKSVQKGNSGILLNNNMIGMNERGKEDLYKPMNKSAPFYRGHTQWQADES